MSDTTVRAILRLRRDATIERDATGWTALVERHARAPLGALSRGQSAAIDLLTHGADEDGLVAAVVAADGEMGLLALQMLLRRLDNGGWLDHEVATSRPVVTLEPIGHDLKLNPRPLDAETPVALSSFAYLRARGGTLVVETPRAAVRVVLHTPTAISLIGAVAAPVTPVDLDVPGLDATVAIAVLRLLASATMVMPPDEEAERALAQWAFADLLFHARSRVGRNVGSYGGSYRLAGRFEPLPGVRPAPPRSLELPRPDLDHIGITDLPLSRAIETRQSVREHDDANPLTVGQLGEFLYRCARNRAVLGDGRQDMVSRPYPAGGALHELELYPLVHNVAGVEQGLYHYDPATHSLGLVAEPGPKVTLLREHARFTGVMSTPPQVVLLIAARFGRMMWKYESMAYAATLKHVGVLYQTMYLVATAMGLAPCALGGGNPDTFADAVGTDYYDESSVGEFLLGSRRAHA